MEFRLGVAYLSIIIVLVMCAWMIGHSGALNQFYEVCAEARERNYKLQTCGYYKWQADDAQSKIKKTI